MLSSRTLRVLLVALCFAAACKSNDSKSGSSIRSTPVKLADLCEEIAKARCIGVQRCCPIESLKYASGAACEKSERAFCEKAQLPALKKKGFALDTKAAGEMIAIARHSAAQCAEAPAQIALSSLLVPALKPGDACNRDPAAENACKGSTCLANGMGAASGTCAPIAQEDEACPHRICAEGLGCFNGTGEWLCGSLTAEGEACRTGSKCAEGLSCMETTESINAPYVPWDITMPLPVPDDRTYACRKPRELGEVTLRTDECASGLTEYSVIDTSYKSRCIACTQHSDCLQEGPEGVVLDSVDFENGYCERGVCKNGTDGVQPLSKPKGALCEDDIECGSMRCEPGDAGRNVCGEPDLEALYCPKDLGNFDPREVD